MGNEANKNVSLGFFTTNSRSIGMNHIYGIRFPTMEDICTWVWIFETFLDTS